MKTLGQYIKEKRKEIRLTQEKLGEKLNTSQAAVNTWEHGNGYPNRLNLIKLANVFNVEPKELVHLKYKAKIKDSMFEVPPSPTGVITFSVGKGGGGGTQAMTQDGVALTSMEHPYVENKPVAWVDKIWFERPDLAAKIDYDDIFSRIKYANQVPLYAEPLQREWVDLTKEECFELCVEHKDAPFSLQLAVQDKLKEKNGY